MDQNRATSLIAEPSSELYRHSEIVTEAMYGPLPAGQRSTLP